MRGDGPLGRQLGRDNTVEHAVHGQQDFCRPWFLPIRYGQRKGKGFFRDKYHVLHAEVLPNTIYKEYRPDLLLAIARAGTVRLDETQQANLNPEVQAILDQGDKDEAKRKAGSMYNEALQHLTVLQIIGFNPAIREGLTPNPEKYWVFRVGHGINPKAGFLVPVTGNDFSVPKGIKKTGGTKPVGAPGQDMSPPGRVGQDPAATAGEMQGMLGELYGKQQVGVRGDPPIEETHIVDGTASRAVAVTPETVRVDSAGSEPQGDPSQPGEFHDQQDPEPCPDGT